MLRSLDIHMEKENWNQTLHHTPGQIPNRPEVFGKKRAGEWREETITVPEKRWVKSSSNGENITKSASKVYK